MAAKKNDTSFEDYMTRLQALTEEMERGDAPLEKLISMHKEGMEIAARLRQKLEGAQAQLTEVREDAEGKPIAANEAHDEQMDFLNGQ